MSRFDYRILHYCQYDVSKTNEYCDCGEPATHEVWWDDYGRDAMMVCQEHFNKIKQAEESNDQH